MKNLVRQRGAAAFLVLALCLLVNQADLYSQSLNDYRSRTSGEWTDPATWQRYNGSAWGTTTYPPDSSSGLITIHSGHTVIYSSSDIYVNQLVIESGAQVTVNSGVSLMTSDGAGDEITLYGVLYYTGMIPASMPGSGIIKTGGTLKYYSVNNPAALIAFFAVKETGSNWVYQGSSTTFTFVSLSGKTYANLSFESTSGTYPVQFQGSNPLTVEGDFTVGSGVNITVTNTAVNVFKGNYTVSGNISYSTGVQIFTFVGSGEQILAGAGTMNFENLNVGAGSLVKMNSNVSITGAMNVNGTLDCGDKSIGGTGTFSLLSGGTLKTASLNGVNGCIACASSLFAPDACYEFNGNARQSTGTKLISCGNLRINNPDGVNLSVSVTAAGTVYFLSGKLYSGNNNLTLGNTGAVSGAGQNSYFATNGTGYLKKLSMPAGSDFLFPVGNNSYTPMTINYTGSADDFSVRTVDTVDFVSNNSACIKKKWVIAEGSPGGTSALLKFGWNTSDQNAQFNPSGSVCIIKYDGLACTEISALVSGSGPYTASANGFSQFGEFTVGNESTLPAEMIFFRTSVYKNTIELKWKTSSEYGSAGYFIERKDPLNNFWNERGFVKSRESTAGSSYSYTDEVNTAGEYTYRLRQEDLNGAYTYYYLKGRCLVEPPVKFRLLGNYPNPFNSGFIIKYETPEDCNMSVNFFDAAGRKIKEAYFREYAGYSSRYFDFSGFASGIYIYYINAMLTGGVISAVGKCIMIK